MPMRLVCTEGEGGAKMCRVVNVPDGDADKNVAALKAKLVHATDGHKAAQASAAQCKIQVDTLQAELIRLRKQADGLDSKNIAEQRRALKEYREQLDISQGEVARAGAKIGELEAELKVASDNFASVQRARNFQQASEQALKDVINDMRVELGRKGGPVAPPPSPPPSPPPLPGAEKPANVMCEKALELKAKKIERLEGTVSKLQGQLREIGAPITAVAARPGEPESAFDAVDRLARLFADERAHLRTRVQSLSELGQPGAAALNRARQSLQDLEGRMRCFESGSADFDAPGFTRESEATRRELERLGRMHADDLTSLRHRQEPLDAYLRERVGTLERDLKDCDRRVRDREIEVNTLKGEYDRNRAHMQRDRDIEVECASAMQPLRTEIARLSSELDTALNNPEAGQLQTELAQARARIATLTAAAKLPAVDSARVERAETDARQARAALAAKEAELAAAKRETEAAESVKPKLDARARDIEQRQAKLDTIIQSLEEALRNCTAENQNLKTKSDGRRDELTANLSRLESEHQECVSTITSLDAKLAAIHAENNELQSKQSETNAEIELLKAQKTDKDAAEKKVAELTKKARKLDQQVAELRAKSQGLEEDLTEAFATAQQKHEEQKTLGKSQTEHHESDLANLQNDLQDLRSQMDVLTSENAKLTSEKARNDAEIAEKKEEVTKMNEHVKALEEGLEEKDEELKKTCIDYEEESSAKRKSADECLEVMREMGIHLLEEEKKADSATAENASLNKALAEGESMVASLQSELEKEKALVASFQDELKATIRKGEVESKDSRASQLSEHKQQAEALKLTEEKILECQNLLEESKQATSAKEAEIKTLKGKLAQAGKEFVEETERAGREHQEALHRMQFQMKLELGTSSGQNDALKGTIDRMKADMEKSRSQCAIQTKNAASEHEALTSELQGKISRCEDEIKGIRAKQVEHVEKLQGELISPDLESIFEGPYEETRTRKLIEQLLAFILTQKEVADAATANEEVALASNKRNAELLQDLNRATREADALREAMEQMQSQEKALAALKKGVTNITGDVGELCSALQRESSETHIQCRTLLSKVQNLSQG